MAFGHRRPIAQTLLLWSAPRSDPHGGEAGSGTNQDGSIAVADLGVESRRQTVEIQPARGRQLQRKLRLVLTVRDNKLQCQRATEFR